MKKGAARDVSDILHEIEAAGASRVKVGGFDVDGILRGKSVSPAKFRSAVETGFGFCDVIFGWDSGDVLYDAAKFTGWHTGYPDVLAKVDLATYRKIPWEGETPFFLVDFYGRDGAPLPISPRSVLSRVVETARERGFEPRMSCEFELFFFKETPHTLREKGFRDLTPLSPGMFGYSVYRASANAELVEDLVRFMRAFDCDIEGIHTETGPGVYEVALGYSDALHAADRAMLFKTGAKEIAARHGLIACFMAKPNASLPGCSGHIHQSLWDAAGDENLFGKRDSDVMRRFGAGQIATMREFLPFYLPTINSYKRTVPGTWAPASATWGHENRTTALRFIEGPGGPSKATRIEFRLTGADINAYIAFAACLAAGLHGIHRKLDLPPERKGNAYENVAAEERLARSLEAALPLLQKSEVAREYLGEPFVEHYLTTRDWEVRESQKAVTDWELARYMEII